MKQPMKSRDVLPKNVPGVGWGQVGCVMQVWDGSYRGGVGYVMQGWVGHTGVGYVIQGWSGSHRGG